MGVSEATKILVVDDETNIRELVATYLKREGYETIEAADGDQALALVRTQNPALVILDIMLPGRDGLDVCRTLRRDGGPPIIMLTAKSDEVDRVVGLELGADDYVAKPFSPRELVARVKAVLRRVAPAAGSQASTAMPSPGEPAGEERQRIVTPDFTIDYPARELTVRGGKVPCPVKEFELLWLLCNNPNRVFTREQLLRQVWDYDYYGDLRTVDVHIRRLREKIEPPGEEPRYIKTVWGVGYKFEGVK